MTGDIDIAERLFYWKYLYHNMTILPHNHSFLFLEYVLNHADHFWVNFQPVDLRITWTRPSNKTFDFNSFSIRLKVYICIVIVPSELLDSLIAFTFFVFGINNRFQCYGWRFQTL